MAFECEAKAMKSEEIVGIFQSPARSFGIRRSLWGRLREFLFMYMQSKLRHTYIEDYDKFADSALLHPHMISLETP